MRDSAARFRGAHFRLTGMGRWARMPDPSPEPAFSWVVGGRGVPPESDIRRDIYYLIMGEWRSQFRPPDVAYTLFRQGHPVIASKSDRRWEKANRVESRNIYLLWRAVVGGGGGL